MARGLSKEEEFFRRVESLALSALPTQELLAGSYQSGRHSGVMVALVPDDPASLEIDGDTALPSEELHVTLCFLGKVQNLSAIDKSSILARTRSVCNEVGHAFSTTADGVVVMGQDDNGTPATAILVQSDDIVSLYDALSDALDYHSNFPSFIPHMTIGYGLPVDDVQPMVGREISFSNVVVKFGDEGHLIPLAASIVAAPRSVNVIDRVIDSLGRLWDEALHPRGSDGRFIKKNGAVSGNLIVPSPGGRGVTNVDANRASVIGFHTFDNDVWVLAEIVNADGSKVQGFAKADDIRAVAPVKARLDALYPLDLDKTGVPTANSSLERNRQLDLLLAHIDNEYGLDDTTSGLAFLDTLGLWNDDLDYLYDGESFRAIDHDLTPDEYEEVHDIINDARQVKELRDRVHQLTNTGAGWHDATMTADELRAISMGDRLDSMTSEADDIDELAESISQDGITKPLQVELTKSGPVLTDGYHRLLAGEKAGLTSFPVRVYDDTPEGRSAANRAMADNEFETSSATDARQVKELRDRVHGLKEDASSSEIDDWISEYVDWTENPDETAYEFWAEGWKESSLVQRAADHLTGNGPALTTEDLPNRRRVSDERELGKAYYTAKLFLEKIRDSEPQDQPLFRAEAGMTADERGFTTGQTLDWPSLVPTSRNQRGVIDLYTRSQYDNKKIPSVLFTTTGPVQSATFESDSDLGTEDLMSGRFEIVGIDTSDPLLSRVTVRQIPSDSGQEDDSVGTTLDNLSVTVPYDADLVGVKLYMGDKDKTNGVTVRGVPMSYDDERIPETLYHVTTNASAVRDSGYLRAGGVGGLGGDSDDKIVSMTIDKQIAETLQTDLRNYAQLHNEFGARPPGEKGSSENRQWAEDVHERLQDLADEQGWSYTANINPATANYSLGSWFSDFFNRRDTATDAQMRNPVIFDGADWSLISPEDVQILEIDRNDLTSTGAMITDFDLGRRGGLEEIRAYGDVPIRPGSDGPSDADLMDIESEGTMTSSDEAIDTLKGGADPFEVPSTTLFDDMVASGRFTLTTSGTETGISVIHWLEDDSDPMGRDVHLAGLQRKTANRAYFVKDSAIGAEFGNSDIVREVLTSLLNEQVIEDSGAGDKALLMPKSVFADNPEWDGTSPQEDYDDLFRLKVHQPGKVLMSHAEYLFPSDWTVSSEADERLKLKNDVKTAIDPSVGDDMTAAYNEDRGNIFGNSAAKMVLFDYVIQNGDRNANNAILAAPPDGSEGKVVLFDHGNAYDNPPVDNKTGEELEITEPGAMFAWLMDYPYARGWIEMVRGGLRLNENVTEESLRRAIADFIDAYGSIDVDKIIERFRAIPGVTDDQISRVESVLPGVVERIDWIANNMDTVYNELVGGPVV